MALGLAQIEALQNELKGASDRAAAIVAGVFLDDTLKELLCGFLIKGTDSEGTLFSGSGALATFSAKIEMAFRLGLISADEHRILTVIRKIRNEFAHVLADISFATQSVQARCENIEVRLAMVIPKDIPLPRHGEDPPLPKIEKAARDDTRAIFQETVLTLMHALAARISGASQRVSPPAFVAAHEPGEFIARRLRKLITQVDTLAAKVVRPEAKADGQLGRPAKSESQLAGAAPPAPDEAMQRWGVLLRVQEFSVTQIKRAHEALRGATQDPAS